MTSTGSVTSLTGLARAETRGETSVTGIEIPMIQRDYAQGRTGERSTAIRREFVGALVGALTDEQQITLDFVYGVVEHGVLRPLDGQQRLTTLFLLHWYVASRADALRPDDAWCRFSYATRPSSRTFCKRLITEPFPDSEGTPSEWLRDRPWFHYVWVHDPTVQSMLVVLDEIHRQFEQRAPRPERAWQILSDVDHPAVVFHLLPIDDMGAPETLYIKMNSRGKPLTPFENFKASFEQAIAGHPRAVEFARKMDGAWADLLWPWRDDTGTVDAPFYRLFDFLSDVRGPQDGADTSTPLLDRAVSAFGGDGRETTSDLDFVFSVLDALHEHDIATLFASLFDKHPPGDPAYDPATVTLHTSRDTNLFASCLEHFDSRAERSQAFGLADSLLLYAVFLHLADHSEDFHTRLRELRNLLNATGDDVRRARTSDLLADTEKLVLQGGQAKYSVLREYQAVDEERKRPLRDDPNLADVVARLEDHDLLRGTLTAFDLSTPDLPHRAQAFDQLFDVEDNARGPLLTAALLASGDYFRNLSTGKWQFGSSTSSVAWRALFTGSPTDLAKTRAALMDFLDNASCDAAGPAAIRQRVDTWLNEREESATYDWRYYLVKYDDMRSGHSGIYVSDENEPGYTMCMLRRSQMNSYYRDPFLYQMWNSSQIADAAEDPWFFGYMSRRLRLRASGTEVENLRDRFAVRCDTESSARLAGLAPSLGLVEKDEHRFDLLIRQSDGVDQENRIDSGAALLRSLVAGGL